jgi:hypothetical protein
MATGQDDQEAASVDERTEAEEATRAVDSADADHSHEADRPATEAEERVAEDAFSKDGGQQRRDVAEHEKEMMEIGATVKGEGEIE